MQKYRSKLGLSTLLLTSAGLLLAMSSFAPAFATSATKGYATFGTTFTSEILVSTHNGYTTWYFAYSADWQGLVTGTGTGQFTLVVAPNGHDVFSGSDVCTACTVNGAIGGMTDQYTGKGTFGASDGTIAVTGQSAATGSGGLAGFTDMCKLVSTNTPTGFTGVLDCTYTLPTT
jgi:hypothetical protein